MYVSSSLSRAAETDVSQTQTAICLTIGNVAIISLTALSVVAFARFFSVKKPIIFVCAKSAPGTFSSTASWRGPEMNFSKRSTLIIRGTSLCTASSPSVYSTRIPFLMFFRWIWSLSAAST